MGPIHKKLRARHPVITADLDSEPIGRRGDKHRLIVYVVTGKQGTFRPASGNKTMYRVSFVGRAGWYHVDNHLAGKGSDGHILSIQKLIYQRLCFVALARETIVQREGLPLVLNHYSDSIDVGTPKLQQSPQRLQRVAACLRATCVLRVFGAVIANYVAWLKT